MDSELEELKNILFAKVGPSLSMKNDKLHWNENELLQRMQETWSDPRVIDHFKHSQQDNEIYRNIYICLCNNFNLPITSIDNGRLRNAILYKIASIIYIDIDNVEQSVINLQSKIGRGSLILYSDSPEKFIKSEYNVTNMSFWLKAFPHKVAIVENKLNKPLFFVSLEIMEMLDIQYKEPASNAFSIIIVILDKPNHPIHFVRFQHEILLCRTNLTAAIPMEWRNKKTLIIKNNTKVMQTTMASMVNLEFAINISSYPLSSSLRHFVNNLIPQSLISLITGSNSQKQLKCIMQKLERNIKLNQEKYTKILLDTNPYKSIDSMSDLFKNMGQFEFMFQAKLDIISIIEWKKYLKYLKYNKQYRKNKSFCKLIKKLIPKRCSHCKRKEKIEINQFKKFKICSGCQKRKYCTVKCQKRDWKYQHRFHCNHLAQI